METQDPTILSPWQRVMAWLETGLCMMARYPYDISECNWDIMFREPPDDDGPSGGYHDTGPHRRPPTRPGRGIKLIPPPSAQRYRDARVFHIPGRRRRRQPV